MVGRRAVLLNCKLRCCGKQLAQCVLTAEFARSYHVYDTDVVFWHHPLSGCRCNADLVR